ncbi:MAG: ClpXP protease specificity-enhancing factor [Brachymonas sp.]
MIDSSQSTSTRPYLLRALYEWCADNSLTPYIAAYVDETVKVPREYVKNNEIVLNISMDATSNLKIDNECVRFKARFGGVAREIVVPMGHVIAIYARENGQGMAFPVPQSVPPRGQVQPTPQEEKCSDDKRISGLRVVDDPDATLPEPSKIVPIKSPAADEPLPEPPSPAGGDKRGSRPSLTRIK